MQNKKIIIGAAVFLLAVAFSGFYIYRDFKSAKDSLSQIQNAKESPSQTGSLEDFIKSGKVKVEVEPAPLSEASPEEIKKLMPDLDGEIIVKANLSEENKNRAISEIKITIAGLKADYNKLEGWLNLGLWRKTLGDYEGAAEAWQFATLIRPNDPVAFHNLGDLYSQFLPDFPSAEKYYKMAVEKDKSHQPFFYVKLYEFYRYYEKNMDAAENTLLDGLKTNPGDAYLEGELNNFRKERKP